MLFIVQYMLPFVINQSGSVLYYVTLSSVGE